MTPLDSGEREVREFPADADGVCRTKFVLVSLPLAQRILAALDALPWAVHTDELVAVKAELRAAVERKP